MYNTPMIYVKMNSQFKSTNDKIKKYCFYFFKTLPEII